MRQSSSSSSSLSSSKPISSPGRALFDKFPPPLIRFLRSKSTKPKSKRPTTPLFFRRKKPTSETQQEPSSPKVTCIGQVRVRRASRRRNDKRRCSFAGKCNLKKRFRLIWSKCVLFFCCGPDKVRTQSESNRVEECEIGNKPDLVESVKLGFTASSETTPPKNALMLTRCRSAPYRSSSLACRLWGHADEEEERETPANKTETIPSISNSAAIEGGDGRNSAAEERIEKIAAAPLSPPLLSAAMRCRSEPARRGSEKLDPLTSEFWRERRLSNTDSS